MTESDVIALLAGAGKTLALHNVLSRMPEMAVQQESVEIYLYMRGITRNFAINVYPSNLKSWSQAPQ